MPIASALLVGLAALGLVLTQSQRQTAARDYAEAASYNRAITSILFDHRRQLTERHVAVFGLSGMSPFSLTSGRYLTRLLGAPSTWHVYVPRTDAFYPPGIQLDGNITVRPESSACESSAMAVYLVFDSEGRGSFAKDCRSAAEAAHPVPEVENWEPRHVTPQMAAAGFNFAVTGNHLGGAVGLRIEGRSIPTVQARRGQLMTATVSPLATPGGAIAFTVEHRGRPAFQGQIDVGPEPENKAPGDTGGLDAYEPRRAVRP
jgi:hypothetical protein